MDVQSYRAKFSASRSNRYRIDSVTPPGIGNLDQNTLILYAKATSVPGSIVNFIPVGHQGRLIKFGGERQFGEWVVQIYDATVTAGPLQLQQNIRKYFEDWINLANSAANNDHRFDIGTGSNWTVSWDDINHSSTEGQPMGSSQSFGKQLKLFNCWPSDISPIDLSYDQADAFSEFTVTMNYDYHLYV